MPFETIQEVKKANAILQLHWFDDDTMRWFRSEIESDLMTLRDDRQFFITSEQFIPSQGDPFPRLFSIRQVLPDGRVQTLGKFQEYETKQEALKVLAQMHSKSKTKPRT